MKKYLSIILLLLLAPAVMANLEVEDIRGYVNNDRVSDVDENGGDFDVQQSDAIDLVVRLKNNGNATVQAKLTGTIENIDDNADITKTQDYYDVGVNDSITKTLSFTIPSDARIDQFDMKLKVINGSGTTIRTLTFNVIVDEKVRKEASINEVLSNLTASCNIIAQTTSTCFNYIGTAANCSSELSTVKEERGTYLTQANDCAEVKAELERQKATLDNQIINMVTTIECINQTATAVGAVKENSDKKFNQTVLGIGLAAVAYVFYQKKKKSKGSTAKAFEEEYFSQN